MAEQEWQNGFWECCSPCKTCCLATWCPCCLFGRTASRLKDPQLKEHGSMNGDCFLFCLLGHCGLSFIPLTMKRGTIRERFHLEGSGCGDCVKAACCPCCTLMQNEKEAESRAALLEQGMGYKAPAGMEYQH
ncbi:PLAC8 family protein [Aspergillus saccharolyticus JOP 1030-1]|uniref:PLAC8-domain-containing protein n=1 Tax=Aspergillus saccharolyticus JOP 1030-1 TaxID=1450539 RepID=A0A318Z7G2_9EURO|nr:PLAC8-domain-containing protein [Aspergillus saccharolyticus JOP 1030-1]PYH42337.1 PLAC8-domain-containing protein [Aspergillus saccharolyticus JOP 1030-1]